MDGKNFRGLGSIIEAGRSQARLLSSPPKQKRRHIFVSPAPPISKPTSTVDKWQVNFLPSPKGMSRAIASGDAVLVKHPFLHGKTLHQREPCPRFFKHSSLQTYCKGYTLALLGPWFSFRDCMRR